MLRLNRIWHLDNCVIGIITAPQMRPLFTLELPWRNNEKNISCIPTGVHPVEKTISTKNKWVKKAYEVIVEFRDDIQIHIANKPSEIKGCIGLGLGADTRAEMVTHSTSAIEYFMDFMSYSNIKQIEVVNYDILSGGSL